MIPLYLSLVGAGTTTSTRVHACTYNAANIRKRTEAINGDELAGSMGKSVKKWINNQRGDLVL